MTCSEPEARNGKGRPALPGRSCKPSNPQGKLLESFRAPTSTNFVLKENEKSCKSKEKIARDVEYVVEVVEGQVKTQSPREIVNLSPRFPQAFVLPLFPRAPLN